MGKINCAIKVQDNIDKDVKNSKFVTCKKM